MTGNDIALVLGAAATLITAIATGVVAIIKINRIHVMVNSQRLAAAKYTKVLVDALRAKGIEVPDDESLE